GGRCRLEQALGNTDYARDLTVVEGPVDHLDLAHPATCDGVADLLGCEEAWAPADPGPSGAELLIRHPDTAIALQELLAGSL
ncbi:hypothetical protein ACWDAZ_41880, partial [Streptomyces sp. NPDC001215]